MGFIVDKLSALRIFWLPRTIAKLRFKHLTTVDLLNGTGTYSTNLAEVGFWGLGKVLLRNIVPCGTLPDVTRNHLKILETSSSQPGSLISLLNRFADGRIQLTDPASIEEADADRIRAAFTGLLTHPDAAVRDAAARAWAVVEPQLPAREVEDPADPFARQVAPPPPPPPLPPPTPAEPLTTPPPPPTLPPPPIPDSATPDADAVTRLEELILRINLGEDPSAKAAEALAGAPANVAQALVAQLAVRVVELETIGDFLSRSRVAHDICAEGVAALGRLIDEADALLAALPETLTEKALQRQQVLDARQRLVDRREAMEREVTEDNLDTNRAAALNPPAAAAAATFTVTASSTGVPRTFTYTTLPDVDYRRVIGSDGRFSDLDALTLRREALENTLTTMWTCISAMGSRMGVVGARLRQIDGVIEEVRGSYQERIDAVDWARQLAVEYVTESARIFSDTEQELARESDRSRRPDETASQHSLRLSKIRQRVLAIEDRRTENLAQLEERITQQIATLSATEGRIDITAILRMGTEAEAEAAFGSLTHSLETERERALNEDSHEITWGVKGYGTTESVILSTRRAALDHENQELRQQKDAVVDQRRQAIAQLSGLRETSQEIEREIAPKLARLTAPLPDDATREVPVEAPTEEAQA